MQLFNQQQALGWFSKGRKIS